MLLCSRCKAFKNSLATTSITLDTEDGDIAKQGIMASRAIFNYRLQPRNIDWNNYDHRRLVAASLVQGVYNLENDRREKRQGLRAQAPPWWNFFHFQLDYLLKDDDHSIFGAIYKFRDSYESAPKHVIAFRGTLLKSCGDLKVTLNLIRNELHKDKRFGQAMQTALNLVTSHEGANIWLAGHSLGSAMALLVGKHMTKMGYDIETYLFNPPFLSVPIEKMGNQQMEDAISIATSYVKAALAVAIGHGLRPSQDDPFVVLSNWKPYLFVNRVDLICSAYIRYFELRKKMEEIGAGKVDRLATQISIRSLLSGNSEPLHLLPSAYLIINPSPSPDFKGAHGIGQWWDPNSRYPYVLHEFM